jgi:hypothetical protein
MSTPWPLSPVNSGPGAAQEVCAGRRDGQVGRELDRGRTLDPTDARERGDGLDGARGDVRREDAAGNLGADLGARGFELLAADRADDEGVDRAFIRDRGASGLRGFDGDAIANHRQRDAGARVELRQVGEGGSRRVGNHENGRDHPSGTRKHRDLQCEARARHREEC